MRSDDMPARPAPQGMRNGDLRDTPIALFSFNRPHLLAAVLESLLAQDQPAAEDRFHLFQDGAREGEVEDARLARECVGVFGRLCPGGTVHAAETNLGVALNFERAERHVFEQLEAPVAFFFEDDMIVSERYLRIMRGLARFALESDRVAQFSAYGLHRLSQEGQAAVAGRIAAMHHAWGYGVTRRFWLRQRPIVEGYLGLLSGQGYRRRPHDRIRDYFETLGVMSQSTSQDAAKRVSAGILGAARITCMEVHGKYIGAEGENYDASLYGAHGFAETALYAGEDRPTQRPTEDALAALACADVTAMAREYYLSLAENAGRTAELDRMVSSIYRGLLSREPDESGGRSMALALRGGMPLHEVLRGVVNGSEFRALRAAE